jgi:pentatricopeptide repeat protein
MPDLQQYRMLLRRIADLRACPCPSTSNSLPCVHSHRRTRTRNLCSTRPALVTDRTTARALEYTAPLWIKKDQRTTTSSTRWGTWIAKSKTSTEDGLEVSPLSIPSADVATPVKVAKKIDQSSALSLVQSYLSLRSPAHSLLRSLPRSAIDQLIKATRRYDLPLAEKLIFEDMKELEEETNKKQRKEIASVKMNTSLNGLVDDWGELIEASRLDSARPLLLDIIQHDSTIDNTLLPPSVLAKLRDSATDLERLQQIWSAFINSEPTSATFESSRIDLRLSLSFLLKLLTPQSNPDSPSLLPLSLQVFRSLTETSISDEVIATAPTETDMDRSSLPRETLIQLILLRTIVGASLEEGMYDITEKALFAIVPLRLKYKLRIGETADKDYGLLESAMKQLLSASSLDVKTSIDSINIAHSLIMDVLPIFDRTAKSPTLGQHSNRVNSILTRFSAEVARRSRWDLFASTRSLWADNQGWIALPHRIKLLRYYGGIAPFKEYALGVDGRVIRPVDVKEFDKLAVSTFHLFKSGRGRVSSVKMGEKSAIVEVLCSSRASSGRSVDLAKRLYRLFQTLSSKRLNPFALVPSALLSLVTASAPPIGNDLNFATQVVADHIISLTSPKSLFSDAKSVITHQDLTMLANCYSLLGDFNSSARVFRKMLDQKMVPDLKDMKVFFCSAARRNPGTVRTYMTAAINNGLLLDEDIFKEVIKETMAFMRRESMKVMVENREGLSTWGQELELLITLGKKSGLESRAITRLETLGKNQMLGTAVKSHESALRVNKLLAGIERNEFNEVRPAVLNKLLSNQQWHQRWSKSLEIYRAGLVRGVTSEETVQLTLGNLLASYNYHRSAPGAIGAIKEAFIEIIEGAPLASFTRVKTFDTILKCCLKLDDLDAVMKISGTMENLNMEPGLQMVQVMRRWAIAKVGVEEINAKGGWIGRKVGKDGARIKIKRPRVDLIEGVDIFGDDIEDTSGLGEGIAADDEILLKDESIERADDATILGEEILEDCAVGEDGTGEQLVGEISKKRE